MADARIALITGATRGIGKAIAEALARQGCVVVGTSTTDAGAAAVSENLKRFTPTGEGARLDVTDAAGVGELVSSIAARLGDVTILVNNAGITHDNLLLRMKEEEWDSIMDTEMTRALADAQRERLLERIPLGRLGAVDEVAHAVAFLASPEASYITGTTLHVNGGMYMA